MRQETYATGAAFICGSFVTNVALGVSSSRLFMMMSCGGRTQLAYVVAALTSLLTIFFLSTYASTLPQAVLAAIMFVAFFRGLVNIKRLPKYWRQDKCYVLIFVVTAAVGFTTSFSLSILAGLGLSIAIAVTRTAFPSVVELHHVTSGVERHWVAAKQYESSKPEANTTVLSIHGPVFFASSERVRERILSSLKKSRATQNPTEISVIENDSAHNDKSADHNDKSADHNGKHADNKSKSAEHNVSITTWHMILDFSGVSYIDVAGLRMLLDLHKELDAVEHATLCLACCPETVRATMSRAPKVTATLHNRVYSSIDDAVVASKKFVNANSPNQKQGSEYSDEWEDEEIITVM